MLRVIFWIVPRRVAGEQLKRLHATFRTRRKLEIKNSKCLCNEKAMIIYRVRMSECGVLLIDILYFILCNTTVSNCVIIGM
jgi:hypothetical protein